MYRKFIATVTAASIALTALGSTSAFAGERDNAKAIAAILGIVALGAIIHDNRKDDDKGKVKVQQPRHAAPVYNNRDKVRPYLPKPVTSQPKPRPLPKRAQRKLLPQECFRSFETHRGKVRMFGARCLNRTYDFAHRLPRQCEQTFNTSRGDRRGYDARCLRNQGYSLARG